MCHSAMLPERRNFWYLSTVSLLYDSKNCDLQKKSVLIFIFNITLVNLNIVKLPL